MLLKHPVDLHCFQTLHLSQRSCDLASVLNVWIRILRYQHKQEAALRFLSHAFQSVHLSVRKQWNDQHTHTQTECSYVDTYAGLLITLPPCFQITSSFAKPTLHDDCGGNTNPYYLTSWQYLLAHHCLSLAVYTIVLFPGVREFDALCTLYILF